MRLNGLLASFPLRELLELSAASLVSGAIEVQAPSGLHHLFFVQGMLVHASAPDASGFEAFWPLFELKDASFQFIAGAASVERTISEPLPGLVAKAEALAQEWSNIRPFVPCLQIVPKLVIPAQSDHVRIFEEDSPILSAVDGVRTIADVARAAQLDVLEVCVGLLRLKERGLVSFTQQRVVNAAADGSQWSPTRETPVQKQALSEPAPRAGFFTKLLTEMPVNLFNRSVKGAAVSETSPRAATPSEADDILNLLRS